MATSVPLQVAETIQTAHINRQPSPAHDINPSTAASRKEPVKVEKYSLFPDDGIDEDSGSEVDDDGFSFSILRPKSRRTQFPPMPDLRYEQSYLHSIRTADTWWKIVLITAKDQVMMPFMQGVLYNLAICGWQYWNRSAQLSGSTLGARIRRWWWGVNNWPIHTERKTRRFR